MNVIIIFTYFSLICVCMALTTTNGYNQAAPAANDSIEVCDD